MRTNVDPHVYAPAQLIEHDHQTVNGEAVKLYVANAGKVRMIDTGTGLGLARRKPFIVKNANDAGGQKRLGLLHVGIGAAEVAEDIAAAMHQLEIVACLAHCRNSFFNLDALYNRLPDRHPKLIFKGGTCLSRALGLIERFSEDIDLVVTRDGLAFDGERDPTIADALSNKKRNTLFKDLREACINYVLGDLTTELAELIGQASSQIPTFLNARRHQLLSLRLLRISFCSSNRSFFRPAAISSAVHDSHHTVLFS